jgi:hypothetical protein
MVRARERSDRLFQQLFGTVFAEASTKVILSRHSAIPTAISFFPIVCLQQFTRYSAWNGRCY